MRAHYDFSHGKRGPVLKTPPGKTRITIRIDDDLLEWFRKQVHAAGGGSYQTLINAALREVRPREARTTRGDASPCAPRRTPPRHRAAAGR